MTQGEKRRKKVSELDLNLLVALDALLRERNVTRAGARIGLSQPTMSTALRRLRRFFDDELLVRVGRDFQPTPLAKALSPIVQEILLLIQQAVEGPGHFDPGEAERTFRVLASDYTQLILQPVVHRLAAEAPGLKIRFHSPDERTIRLLRNRRVDLAVLSRLNGFPCQELFTDEWVCAVSKDHPEIRDELTDALFLSNPHVAFEVGWSGRSIAEDHLSVAGIQRNVQFTTESFTASLYLLRGTRLIAIVQRRLGELLRVEAGIRLHPMPTPVPDLVSRMWWNELDTDDPAHTYLRTLIADVAAQA